MGDAFGSLGREVAESIITATSNPFIGLFIGLLVTALIQSSSTTTSMIVALVASGSITLSNAVPMIMGANIGTTLTSTIVSLGYIAKRNEFRRAIAAGTVHDFFNILVVLLLFPLEYYYGLISYLAQRIISLFNLTSSAVESGEKGYQLFQLLPFTDSIVDLINSPFISIGLSFILLFGSIKFLSSLISKMLMGDEDRLQLIFFTTPFKSFLWGLLVTGAVQSSSVTTSLVVPFAATGKINLNRIMPFILGANVGTTVTAFIAAIFRTDLVISIAVTHLIINVIGVLIFLPIPFMRKFLIALANKFGQITSLHRFSGFLYIIMMFFIIPFSLIYLNRETAIVSELVYEVRRNGEVVNQRNVLAELNTNHTGRFNSPSVNNDETVSEIYDIYKDKNVIFMNNNIFLINKPGFCWDDEKKKGKFKMCIEEIRPSMRINDAITVDSVLVIKKEYYNPGPLDSVYYRYFLSTVNGYLVRTEKYDKSGRIMESEQLIDIQN
jgi:sodium-dependent phosphate cotransporter